MRYRTRALLTLLTMPARPCRLCAACVLFMAFVCGCGPTPAVIKPPPALLCTTTIEGSYRYGRVWKGGVPVLILRSDAPEVAQDPAHQQYLYGKLLAVQEDGILFAPRRVSLFYKPRPRVYPFASIQAAVDERGVVVHGQLPPQEDAFIGATPPPPSAPGGSDGRFDQLAAAFRPATQRLLRLLPRARNLHRPPPGFRTPRDGEATGTTLSRRCRFGQLSGGSAPCPSWRRSNTDCSATNPNHDGTRQASSWRKRRFRSGRPQLRPFRRTAHRRCRLPPYPEIERDTTEHFPSSSHPDVLGSSCSDQPRSPRNAAGRIAPQRLAPVLFRRPLGRRFWCGSCSKRL